MPYNGNTLVVDFDDTLCIHPHDDKSNIACGKPNYDLISEINRLFDKGFDIFIYTARGHFSADNRAGAEHKYRNVIEVWLMEHSVSYTKLSFDKPYAVYYIDDKAIRPDELYLLEKL
tara:strand:+ start:1195 stop:1545 length:351 start_codon:yes stop_codon:yes gene_type:complete